jgi:murein DD-endopeptidase MepM/ murein hydrolase activator NlpD
LGFFAAALGLSVTVICAIVPGINMPGHPGGGPPPFPAPAGYLLPWAGGEIHSVTQGEETPFTHNGTAAYAFDFDLVYDTVVAARGGKVTMIRDDSNLGGCSRFYSSSANYVVIDHGDGTSGLYLHLAYDSITVQVGQVVAQGEAIAVSGETGVTCAGEGMAPGPHLHFQVEQTQDGMYFTQSLPIAFDDVPGRDGVPVEGTSLVSGNYGPGKPQKIKLTPRRVSRDFDPRAVPLNPSLIEADPAAVPTPTPGGDNPQAPAATATETPTETPWPTIVPDSTEPPTEEPTETPTEAPSETPVPPNTATPVPPPPTPLPPTATSTPTPEPAATDTDVPAQQIAPSDTPTPVG